MDNTYRDGFFTSSQMSRLIGFESRKMTAKEKEAHLKENPKSRKQNIEIDGFASKGHTYIEEVVLERIMERSIDTEVNTVPIKWGRVMEIVLFNLLDVNWQMTHKQTKVHDKYPKFWSGTSDLVAETKIGEIKCFQPKNFMRLSLVLRACRKLKSYLGFKSEFPDEYWQCVSNAILHGKKRAEIIAYMPYRKELLEILRQIEDTNFLERNGLEPNDYYFMREENIESLAYLPNDSKVSNVNSFEFEIPQEDLDFLEQRVVDAESEARKLYKKLAA